MPSEGHVSNFGSWGSKGANEQRDFEDCAMLKRIKGLIHVLLSSSSQERNPTTVAEQSRIHVCVPHLLALIKTRLDCPMDVGCDPLS